VWSSHRSSEIHRPALPLRGAPLAQVAVAWRTAHETDLARAFVRTALDVGEHPAD
jgi:hypothetical protein